MFMQMCAKARATISGLKRDERGVSALEYTILAAVVVAAVIAAAPTIKSMYDDAFTATSEKVTTAIAGQ